MSSTKLTLIKRDDKTYTVNFSDVIGDPIDITGYTVFFTVKINKTDTDDVAVIAKDITSHSDPTAGETQIVLTDTDTDIAVGDYFYDIQLKTDVGEIKTVVIGQLVVRQDVTVRTS